MSFLGEIKRRKVFQVAAVYAVVAWLLVQVIVSVEAPLSLPNWTDTLVIVLLAVGFVVALFLAWAYELTPDGVKRTPTPAGGHEPASVPATGYVITAVLAGLLGATLYWLISRDTDAEWLRATALPEIERVLSAGDWQAAYTLVKQAEARVPDSPELAQLWPRMSWDITLRSEPLGAVVFRRAYGDLDSEWEEFGITPIEGARLPFGLSQLRLELDGYLPLERLLGGGLLIGSQLPPAGPQRNNNLIGNETFKLDTTVTLPQDMVRVPGWSMVVDGEALELGDFFLGRYEVTNAEYKAFVDAGGYQKRNLWEPITNDGEAVPWEEAMVVFVDRTGQVGPSTWEAGDYPEGEGDLPISGVSWYEAAAYARFSGKELPTAHHWRRALALATLPWLLPASNFSGEAPRAVRESQAMGYTGTFDMAGNVREWTASAREDERVILGGSWADAYYLVAADATSAPALDRSPGNGFRLAVTDDEPAIATRARAPLQSSAEVSAVLQLQPVSEEIFDAYGRVFDYDRGSLNASIDATEQTRSWTRERILFDAGYGGEQMVLYLYLPTVGTPPFQTVVYWPGWDAFRIADSVDYSKHVDFIVKSGRAVAFPVYKGIFERGDRSPRPPFNTTAYRDNAVEGVKDLRRTIDYLEGRREIDMSSLAYYGYSWGGVNGPAALAQESRFSLAMIYVGLLPPLWMTPEIDPVNALPRVTVPVLLLSGEFDPLVPIENARRYFELLGTAGPDKRHVIAPAGHYVPRDLLIRETLNWLDGYLGRPSR